MGTEMLLINDHIHGGKEYGHDEHDHVSHEDQAHGRKHHSKEDGSEDCVPNFYQKSRKMACYLRI